LAAPTSSSPRAPHCVVGATGWCRPSTASATATRATPGYVRQARERCDLRRQSVWRTPAAVSFRTEPRHFGCVDVPPGADVILDVRGKKQWSGELESVVELDDLFAGLDRLSQLRQLKPKRRVQPIGEPIRTGLEARICHRLWLTRPRLGATSGAQRSSRIAVSSASSCPPWLASTDAISER